MKTRDVRDLSTITIGMAAWFMFLWLAFVPHSQALTREQDSAINEYVSAQERFPQLWDIRCANDDMWLIGYQMDSGRELRLWQSYMRGDVHPMEFLDQLKVMIPMSYFYDPRAAQIFWMRLHEFTQRCELPGSTNRTGHTPT